MTRSMLIRVGIGIVLLAGLIAGCSGGPMAQSGDRVTVHYRGTLDSGEEFDSSIGGTPFPFTVGANEVIAGFDQAVLGMAVGEKKTVRIPAAEAYGEHREDLVLVVPAAEAPEGLAVGQQVYLGETPATITHMDAESVTVDANHPLAGEALTFELELVSIN